MAGPVPAVTLISGTGSNLAALLRACAQAGLPLEMRAVISNRADAGGLAIAEAAGVATDCLRHTDFPTREAFDAELRRRIDSYRPRLVLLAGFMRILTAETVAHYHGRMLNIHPSLLPALPGLHTHRRALEQGVAEHGASVHFVTGELDGGPVILQARVPVRDADNPESLAARVLEQEHVIYPMAAEWFARGRLQLRDNAVWMDGKPLRSPRQWVDGRLSEAGHA